MTHFITQVVRVWRGANGQTAECIEDGSPVDAIESFSAIRSLVKPATPIGLHLVLDNGVISNLPFVEGSAHWLPDRTGVVVIFEKGEYIKADGDDHFPAPNNAAIFNSDGSLRFQLKLNPLAADHIAAFHSGSMPPKFVNYMGLIVATHADSPPEWVYAVDPNSPELIPTNQWVRW